MRLYRDLKPKSTSLVIAAIIAAGHAWLTYTMLHLKNPDTDNKYIPLLTYISLPEIKAPPAVIDAPFIHLQPSIIVASPIAAPVNIDIESPQASTVEQGIPATEGNFSGVFDPTLRQKLQAAQQPKRAHEFQVDEHWTGSDGRTYVYVGNGECMVSMAKLDARERGTQWSSIRVPCGKNDSEKAMDRVMADFESRRSRPQN